MRRLDELRADRVTGPMLCIDGRERVLPLPAPGTGFAGVFVAARIDAGMSASRLAAVSGRDRSYISLIESGERIPSPEALHAMICVLQPDTDTQARLWIASGHLPVEAPVELRAAIARALVEDVPPLPSLQNRIGTWGDATFPRDTSTPDAHEATCAGVLAHLEDEIVELTDAFGGVTFPLLESEITEIAFEAADCAMLLFQFAHRMGFDLIAYVEDKLVINRNRTWGEPDDRGVVRHVD